jgi:anti-sigma B factor antagonist
MSEFEIRLVEGSGGTRILKLGGPLTLQTLFEFQDLVRKLAAPGLILDLSGVPYMDSAGLGAVLGAYASCQRQGRKFALAHVSPRILTLLQVTHVDTILPRYESAEAAEAQLGGKAESAL